MENYVRGRLGVIIDGTGHKYQSIAGKKQKFEDLGYDCYMVFDNTSLEIALQRNSERDRVVPEKIVRDSWHDVQQNLGGFQRLFGRNFLIVDNSRKRDEDDAMKFFESLVKQGINKFVKAPVKNSIGKKWTDELAVMIDTFKPLSLTQNAINIEVEDYYFNYRDTDNNNSLFLKEFEISNQISDVNLLINNILSNYRSIELLLHNSNLLKPIESVEHIGDLIREIEQIY